MKPAPKDNILSQNDRTILTQLASRWAGGLQAVVIQYIRTKLDDESVARYSTLFGNEDEILRVLKTKFREICTSSGLTEHWLAKARVLHFRPHAAVSNFALFVGDYLVSLAEVMMPGNPPDRKKLEWYALATTQYQSIRAFYLQVHAKIQAVMSPLETSPLADRIRVLLEACNGMCVAYPAAGAILKAIAYFYVIQKLKAENYYSVALSYFTLMRESLRLFFQQIEMPNTAVEIANVCGAEDDQPPLQAFAGLYADLGLWKRLDKHASFAEAVLAAVATEEEEIRGAQFRASSAPCRA